MKDVYGAASPAFLIAPDVYGDDNTPAGVSIIGFRSALILIEVGVGGITFTTNNKIEFKLTHSDDNATYSAVTQKDVSGVVVGTDGIVRSLTAAHATPSVTKIGYTGGKRYLKLLADFSGTHSDGTPISATVVRLDPYLAPVA